MTNAELDRKAAKLVMGWDQIPEGINEWSPSTNISLVLGGPNTIVGSMIKLGWDFDLTTLDDGEYEVCFEQSGVGRFLVVSPIEIYARSTNPARAITEAAVKAIEAAEAIEELNRISGPPPDPSCIDPTD